MLMPLSSLTSWAGHGASRRRSKNASSEMKIRMNGMRSATYEKWEAKFDAAEVALEALCGLALARLMMRH